MKRVVEAVHMVSCGSAGSEWVNAAPKRLAIGIHRLTIVLLQTTARWV